MFMKKCAGIIGWLLLLGQVFMQGSTLLISVICILTGNPDRGVIIGSDVGSFIANGMILGCFWLVKKKDITVSGKKAAEPWFVVGTAWIVLAFWNSACSFLDIATNHVFSMTTEEWSELSFGFQMVTLAVFPAIVEEFAFRKVIFGTMRKYGFPVAAVFSSLCFGLMHQNVIQMIFAAVLGIVMCYVYEHTGKLFYCMLLHFLNNSVSCALPYLEIYRMYGVYIESVLGITAIVLFTVAAVRRKICFRELLQINEQYTYGHMRADIISCFRRVPMIIYTMLCVGIAAFGVFVR